METRSENTSPLPPACPAGWWRLSHRGQKLSVKGCVTVGTGRRPTHWWVWRSRGSWCHPRHTGGCPGPGGRDPSCQGRAHGCARPGSGPLGSGDSELGTAWGLVRVWCSRPLRGEEARGPGRGVAGVPWASADELAPAGTLVTRFLSFKTRLCPRSLVHSRAAQRRRDGTPFLTSRSERAQMRHRGAGAAPGPGDESAVAVATGPAPRPALPPPPPPGTSCKCFSEEQAGFGHLGPASWPPARPPALRELRRPRGPAGLWVCRRSFQFSLRGLPFIYVFASRTLGGLL